MSGERRPSFSPSPSELFLHIVTLDCCRSGITDIDVIPAIARTTCATMGLPSVCSPADSQAGPVTSWFEQALAQADQAVCDERNSLVKELDDLLGKLQAMIEPLLALHREVIELEYSGTFTTPVWKKDAPDYDNCIRQRMDLKTITSELENGRIYTKDELLYAYRIIVANACAFNEPKSEVFQCALKFQEEFMEFF
mmetsp:Transcript_12983/g.40975  ORF Transcript_12983/g.40975 Transcript_12983/m.40975 type:complete len:196 (-) Transcript_12983:3207-3794(-)